MPNSSSSLFLLSFLLLFCACEHKTPSPTHQIKEGCEYYSLKSAQCQSLKQMTKQLAPYPVIFIGDHHPEDDLHQKTALLIQELSNSGFKVHLANEWFCPSDKKVLTAFTSKDINESEFLNKIEWEKRLKYTSYDSFKPMYEMVKNTKGQLHGINLSKQERKQISDQNLSAMSTQEQLFYHSLDINVSAHKDLVFPYLSHCHAPKKNESLKECSERMYRVQVAWDSKMALESYKLSQKLQQNEKLIVFAGAMHIDSKLGIPLRFARLSNIPFISILPANEQTDEIEHNVADFILFYQNQQKNKK